MTIINEVIKGISSKLHKLTKYPVYVDVKKNHVRFPCFYLKQLDQSQELSVGNRYWQEHSFDIWFMPNAADEVSDVREEIHKMAEAFFVELEYITLSDGSVIRGTDMHYRTTDGALHFFVSYNLFILKEREKAEKMQSLKAEGAVKMAIKKEEQAASEERFDGVTIVKSAKYKRYADILTYLLSEGEQYTHSQIDKLLKDALNQPVKQDIN